MNAVPGWYAAPGEPGVAHYWDGRRWVDAWRSLPPAPGERPITTAPVAEAGYPNVTGPGYPGAGGFPQGTLDALSDMVPGIASVASSATRVIGVGRGITAVVFALFWLGLCLLLVKPFLWDEARAGEGEATIQGTVVTQNSHLSEEGTRMCSPQASFEVAGQTYVASSSGSSSVCPSVGSSVTVIYRVADPEDARVPLPTTVQHFFLVFPLVGVLFLALGIRDLVRALHGSGASRWLRNRRDGGGAMGLRPPPGRQPPAWTP